MGAVTSRQPKSTVVEGVSTSIDNTFLDDHFTNDVGVENTHDDVFASTRMITLPHDPSLDLAQPILVVG